MSHGGTPSCLQTVWAAGGTPHASARGRSTAPLLQQAPPDSHLNLIRSCCVRMPLSGLRLQHSRQPGSGLVVTLVLDNLRTIGQGHISRDVSWEGVVPATLKQCTSVQSITVGSACLPALNTAICPIFVVDTGIMQQRNTALRRSAPPPGGSTQPRAAWCKLGFVPVGTRVPVRTSLQLQ